MKPAVAITVGDYNGIGPEIVLKSIAHPAVRRICTPVLVGPERVFENYARRFHLPFLPVDYRRNGVDRTSGKGETPIVMLADAVATPSPGKLSARAGRTAFDAIREAVGMALQGDVHAVITAPVSKQALHLAGTHYPGQTELIQHLSSSKDVAMMLVSQALRIGLVTIHLPVRMVARAITPSLVTDRVRIIHSALRTDWGVPVPRLAVLGLNPHAGEGGDMGTEERDVIVPAIRRLRRRGLRIEGPFPADAFFARYVPGVYDAVVAMYHDQGLIPLKMFAAGRGVNVSVGLPIVRTSPDHGTGFDIAGHGTADPGSMIEAIKLAVRIAALRGGRSGRNPS